MIKQQKFDSNLFVGMNISKGISLESILQATCALTGVKRTEALSKSRVGRLPYTRQLYSFIAYTLNQKIGSERQSHRKTLVEIADYINVDHSTVISHKYKIEGMADLYEDIQSDIEAIKAKITIKNSGFNTSGIDNSSVGYYNTPERMETLKAWSEKNDVVTQVKI